MLAAADFFTIEVWGLRGLVTFYVFFVIELSSRRIEVAGITPNPNGAWMTQVGQEPHRPHLDGFLAQKTVLDPRPGFQVSLRSVQGAAEQLPASRSYNCHHRSPNLNAYAERFVRSIKDECSQPNDLLRGAVAA